MIAPASRPAPRQQHAQQTLGRNVTVHFWFLACSGARITSADSGPWMTPSGPGSQPADWGGMLDPQSGTDSRQSPPLPAQVDRLRQLRSQSGLPITSLLMTVGANDTGWAVVAKKCAGDIGSILNQPACLDSYASKVDTSVAELPSHFSALASRLNAIVDPNRVYLTDYYDPIDSVRDPQQAGLCGGEGIALGQSYIRHWAVVHIENPLANAVQSAAGQNHWNYLGGIRQIFQGHGVCYIAGPPDGRWVNNHDESQASENTLDGTWHPNQYGQGQMANFIEPVLNASVLQPSPPAPPKVLSAPVLSTASPRVGVQLSVSNGTWTPPDGVSVTYQWNANGAAIANAINSSYTPAPGVYGKTITATVMATRKGVSTSVTTAATSPVALGAAPKATAAPTITGTVGVGKTLTATPGTWSLASLKYSYRWLRAGTAISGATAATYKPVVADVGKRLSVRVTAARTGYASASATSAEVKAVPRSKPVVTLTVPATVSHTAHAKITVKVTVAGVAAPLGTVTITYGTKSAAVALTAANKGVLTYSLPLLAKGSYAISAGYTPTGTTAKYATTATSSAHTLKST